MSPRCRPASSAGLPERTFWDDRAVHAFRRLDLLPHIRRQVRQAKAQRPLPLPFCATTCS